MSGIITGGKKNLSADRGRSQPIGTKTSASSVEPLRLSRHLSADPVARTEPLSLPFAPLALGKTCPDSLKW
jgi:hypothetical protein